MDISNDASDDELQEYLNGWLDAMMEVYGAVLEEWEENNVIQPKEGAHINFECNNCGKCCDFSDHWVWVYPSDIVQWLSKLNEEQIIPLLLGILLPVEDMDEAIGYGLPSQKILAEKFEELIRQQSSKTTKKTYQTILDQIHDLNPGFNKDSESCIFYNPKNEKHCLIHDLRPIQCKTYPYDFAQFTSIKIPEALADKYGAYEDDLDLLPRCPSDAYSGDPKQGVMINEEERDWVTQEKSNYLASFITQDWQEEDISDILLELFHKEIINLERKTKFVSEDTISPSKGPNKQNSKQNKTSEPQSQRMVAGGNVPKRVRNVSNPFFSLFLTFHNQNHLEFFGKISKNKPFFYF